MKTYLPLLLLLSLKTFASPPTIGDFCYNESCSNSQQVIWQDYKDSKALDNKIQNSVYSGECFHSSPMYSNKYTHHAVVFIEKTNQGHFFNPKFSFYSRINPYKSWDLLKAKRELSNTNDTFRRISFYNDFAFVDMLRENKKKPFLMYWLKKSSDRLYLVGLWETRHKLICELKEN
jgi:hypothetical protein